MSTYLHPGVYVEEIPSGSKPIEGVGTSTAAFIGYTTKGPIGEPVLITKWDEYDKKFGGIRNLDKAEMGDPMGLSVSAFYQNGGSKAYIVRITQDWSDAKKIDAKKAVGYVDHPAEIGKMALMFTAVNEGVWANGLEIRMFSNLIDSNLYDVQVGTTIKDEAGNESFIIYEVFQGVSLDDKHSQFIKNVIDPVSELITVELIKDITSLEIISDNYLGTSTSGDLSTGVSLDFSSLNVSERELTIKIDNNVETIRIDKIAYSNLDALAESIMLKVRGLGSEQCYTEFTCKAVENKLVLTSGSRKSSSSVKVICDHGIATKLNLGIPVDSYKGTSTSGDLIGFSSLNLSDQNTYPNEESRSLKGTIDGLPFGPIILTNKSYADLAALATEIENKLASKCSVTAVVDKLVLTSESRLSTSSVRIISDHGIAPALKLGVSPENPGAVELTGQESFGYDFPIELTGQESADMSLPKDKLDGGVDGNKPSENDYEDVFTKFIKYRDINIICLPGQNWSKDSSGNSIIQKAISHADKMKNRMVIIDPPPTHELLNAKTVVDMSLPSQTYCVLYYPWVKVANRFYNAERFPGLPKTVLVPPSGYAAGMWAKIDGKRGVWKAPAGMEAGLIGAAGLKYIIEDGEQDQLNPLGINCFRNMPGGGRVIWGSRTLATKADPEWRYVPVRRTAIFIEQSIYEGIQWAVFEPNDHRLWSALRGNIDNFMNGLFRVGAFQGEKASDAYFVRCGLGDTMTQGDIDAGQVIVLVGFAPLKPAEFVIVRIQQKVNQQ